jgi:streptogramin lyase
MNKLGEKTYPGLALRALAALALPLCLWTTSGCLVEGEEDPTQDGELDNDDIGEVTIALVSAPVDARCAVITITPPSPAAAIVNKFSLVPGQPAAFTISNLPSGVLTITQEVYTQTCSATGGQTPKWVSDPVIVTTKAGTSVDVTFELRRSDQGARVDVQTLFPETMHAMTEFTLPGVDTWPRGIVTGPDDNIWYVASASNKIGRITTSGKITEFTVPTANSMPYVITAGFHNDLWFLELGSTSKVGRVSTTGSFSEYTLPASIQSTLSQIAITSGTDGNIWFTEPAINKIGRITPTGVLTEFTVPTANSSPSGIATGPDGNLWFTELLGNKIGRITLAGVITEFTIPSAGSTPRSIVAGPDGNLWFTEGNVSKIARMTTAGVVTEFALPNACKPAHITVGGDRNLWFTDGCNKVARMTTAGVLTEFPSPTGNSTPFNITAGPDGAIWFTELTANKIGRISL